MKIRISILIITALALSACSVNQLTGSAEEIGCYFLNGEKADHCYQDAAVRQGDPAVCAKIKAENFTAVQGPAPRDKCYLRVAAATGDPAGCANIEGGAISYSLQECLYRAAITADNPKICEQIEGSFSTFMETFNQARCLKELGATSTQEVDYIQN
jgi:hypothetical protein